MSAAATWLVPVTALRRTAGAQRHEQRRGRFGELRVADTIVPAEAEAEADVVLSALDGGVEVHGTVRAAWRAECRRCLRPVGGELVAEVRELYRPQAGLSNGEEGDGEAYPLGSDHLDLAPLVRDALLLALPLAPLCREDCAGLCPRCGADLAEHPCDCAPLGRDSPWAVLDGLLDPGADTAGDPGSAEAGATS